MKLLSSWDGEHQHINNSMSIQKKHGVNVSDFSNYS
ncbi:hypothetical protein DJ50_5004 [Bacillus cereus ATCC 10876]|nr:hypothetical protein DJ50_5004 [Bacillus cereus ATCC 10876]